MFGQGKYELLSATFIIACLVVGSNIKDFTECKNWLCLSPFRTAESSPDLLPPALEGLDRAISEANPLGEFMTNKKLRFKGQTFLLTVTPAGPDYLKNDCLDIEVDRPGSIRKHMPRSVLYTSQTCG